MVDEAKAGRANYLVFSFSSHGTPIPDQNGDETDKWDEAFCPYDTAAKGGQWDPNTIIVDDEPNARARIARLLDQRAIVAGGAFTLVDDEVGVHRRDFHAAERRAFQPGGLDQAPGIVARRVLEDAAQRCSWRLGALAVSDESAGARVERFGIVARLQRQRDRQHQRGGFADRRHGRRCAGWR